MIQSAAQIFGYHPVSGSQQNQSAILGDTDFANMVDAAGPKIDAQIGSAAIAAPPSDLEKAEIPITVDTGLPVFWPALDTQPLPFTPVAITLTPSRVSYDTTPPSPIGVSANVDPAAALSAAAPPLMPGPWPNQHDGSLSPQPTTANPTPSNAPPIVARITADPAAPIVMSAAPPDVAPGLRRSAQQSAAGALPIPVSDPQPGSDPRPDSGPVLQPQPAAPERPTGVAFGGAVVLKPQPGPTPSQSPPFAGPEITFAAPLAPLPAKTPGLPEFQPVQSDPAPTAPPRSDRRAAQSSMAIAWQSRASSYDVAPPPQTIPEAALEDPQSDPAPAQAATPSDSLPPTDVAPPRDGPVPAVTAVTRSLAGAPAISPEAPSPQKPDAQISLSAPNFAPSAPAPEPTTKRPTTDALLPDPSADPQIVAADPLPPLPSRLESPESPRNLPLSQITASPVASDRTAVPTALVPALIDFSRDAGSGTLELSLAPEELGRLHMSLVQDGDMVRVTLIAERPETLDLMRRHADQLSQEFRQAGFSGASLSFGQWGAGGSNQQRPAVDSPTNAAPDPAFLSPQLRPGATLAATSGLDLRL